MIVAPIPILGRKPIIPWTCQRLRKNGIIPLCIVEADKDRAVLQSYGFLVKQVKKMPLGAKWNAGFEWARDFDPDAVLFVGSDDWVSDNLEKVLLPYLSEFDMIGLKGAYFIHRQYNAKPYFHSLGEYKHNLYYWGGYNDDREGEAVGGGRLLSSNILRKMKWRPFKDANNRNMDFNMLYSVMNNGGRAKTYSEDEAKVLAWSTDLWGTKHDQGQISASNGYHNIKDVDDFLTKYFPEGLELWNVVGVYSQIGKQ